MSLGPDAPSPWGQPAPVYSGPAGAPARNGDGPDHALPYRPRPHVWAGDGTRVDPPGRLSGRRRLFRVVRSSTALVVIALSLGVAVAAALAGMVWLLAAAIHHAAGN